MRVTIIGAGKVGTTIAYSIMDFVDNITMIDIDEERLIGEVLDLRDAREIHGSGAGITYNFAVNEKSDVYIITVGESLKNGDDRNIHLEANKKIVGEILDSIKYWNTDPIIIMVTNPSHELAKLALDEFSHVIACGRKLDTVRTKVAGKHEDNKIVNHRHIISNFKGFTNWAIGQEVREILLEMDYGQS